MDLAQLFQHRARRPEVLGTRCSGENEQGSAVDRWSAADDRRLDQPGSVELWPAFQFLGNAGPGCAHVHDDLVRRRPEHAVFTEVDVAYRLRAGHHADDNVRVPGGISRRIGDGTNPKGFGLIPCSIPDRNLKAAFLQPARNRASHLSAPEHRYLGHGFRMRRAEIRNIPLPVDRDTLHLGDIQLMSNSTAKTRGAGGGTRTPRACPKTGCPAARRLPTPQWQSRLRLVSAWLLRTPVECFE